MARVIRVQNSAELGGFYLQHLVESRRVAARQPPALHLPLAAMTHHERAHRVASVLTVDLVYRLHEPYPPLVVNPEQQILLLLGVGYDVGEEDPRLVVDKPVVLQKIFCLQLVVAKN